MTRGGRPHHNVVRGRFYLAARVCGMKIDLSAAPHRVPDLFRFLRTMGYGAREVDYAQIEVDAADNDAGALFTLALRLDVWNAVNETQARLVDVDGRT